MKNAIPIGDLLGRAMKRAGIEREVTRAQVLEAANGAITKALPVGHGADAKAVSLRDGVLVVSCRHAAAAQTVFRAGQAIVAELKRTAPRVDIRRLATQIESTITRSNGMVE